ncbi:hypothetical protein [Musicola keenii]|uniref:hypothetical protein n=1 Tax=Musicola keenii TaxID=2884250 RepID=UPI001780DBC2|nr:hypothetical protein [Musicola keenii]
MLIYTYSAINPVAVQSLMEAACLRRPPRNPDGGVLACGVRIVVVLGLWKTYGVR